MKKLICLVLALVMTCSMAVTAFAADTMATDDPTVYVQADKKTFTLTNEDGEDTDSVYGDGNAWNIGVQADFDDAAAQTGRSADVYYVVVEWDVTSTLKYTLEDDAYCWTVYADAEGTQEAVSGEAKSAGYILNYDKGTWSGKANINVKVTNWSNVDVTYSMAWAAATTTTDNNKVHTDLKFAEGAVSVDAGTSLAAVVAKDAAETGKLYTTAASATSTVAIDGDNNGITGAIKADDALIGTLTVTIAKVGSASQEPADPADP